MQILCGKTAIALTLCHFGSSHFPPRWLSQIFLVEMGKVQACATVEERLNQTFSWDLFFLQLFKFKAENLREMNFTLSQKGNELDGF